MELRAAAGRSRGQSSSRQAAWGGAVHGVVVVGLMCVALAEGRG
jgi:hypothetical protein